MPIVTSSRLHSPSPSPQRDADARLGAAIRALRHERAMTLVQVAEASGLSHPFLSQLEHGRARPSMRSLFRIAGALGTTQQALLAAAHEDTEAEPTHAADVELIEVPDGGARLVMHHPGEADVTEFVGAPRVFYDFFQHERHEWMYVVKGRIEVEIRTGGSSRLSVLGERDTIGYPGMVEHRFRQLGPEKCVVLVVHTGPGDHRPAAVADGVPATATAAHPEESHD